MVWLRMKEGDSCAKRARELDGLSDGLNGEIRAVEWNEQVPIHDSLQLLQMIDRPIVGRIGCSAPP